MAAESIGDLIPTAIPGYADAADIQAALRVYHYGSYAYNPSNTSPGSLVSPSMAKTIYDIQQDIITLENRPSSGGDVSNTAPVPGDFTPSGIPNGYIWVDQDGTIGGQPVSATSVFTNSVPTSDLSTGVIWVDKDPTTITSNPFIPTAVIDAKGDLIAGSGNDSAVRLAVAATNGYVLNVNSATTSGLDWVDSAASTQTFTNKSISLGSNTLTGTISQFNTAVTDADFATLAGSETLTNKTINGSNNTITNIAITSAVSGLGTGIATFLATPSSANLASALTDETGSGAVVFGTTPTIATPTLTLSATSSTTDARISWDTTNKKIQVGNGTTSLDYASSNLQFNAQTGTTYTFVLTDKDKMVTANNASAQSYTIPPNSSVAFPTGTQINIIQIGAGQVTINIGSGVTIVSTGATANAPKLRAQYSAATLIKRDTDLWYVVGDLT